MATFDEYIDSVIKEIGKLAQETLKDYAEDATKDGEDFIKKSKDKLKKWTEDLAEKRMDADEFTSLIKGQKDLAEMKALKQAGLAAVQVDKFRNGVIDLIINKVIGIF